MRNWAGPFGFLGSAVSLAFWLVVPLLDSNVSNRGEALIVVFAVLSAAGLVGAAMAGVSTRLAPALLALAIIPAVGALLLPGLLVIAAALIALQELETAASPRQLSGGGWR